jgi:hypothetical protein
MCRKSCAVQRQFTISWPQFRTNYRGTFAISSHSIAAKRREAVMAMVEIDESYNILCGYYQ